LITIKLEHCTGCGACLEVCPDGALYLVDDQAIVDKALCRECEACVAACPTGAIVVTEQMEEPTPATARVPAIRPAPKAIRIKTEPSPAHLRTSVLPVVGTALIWTAREIVPRLAVYFLDSMDRRAVQRRARGIAQHTSGAESQTGRGGGGRRHRRRRGN